MVLYSEIRDEYVYAQTSRLYQLPLYRKQWLIDNYEVIALSSRDERLAVP